MTSLVLICKSGDVTRSYSGVCRKRVVQEDFCREPPQAFRSLALALIGTNSKCSRFLMYILVGNERMRVHPSGRLVCYIRTSLAELNLSVRVECILL